jgi:leucine dehydrogenase
MIFETLDTYGHEQVVFCHNKDAGLKAIIAIHNTVLGPALGGTRMWPYKTEADALNDVLRLSRGMTVQERGGGPEHRRRQGRDHRRPGEGQERGAVPRVRPVRRIARRPLHHGRGRRHRRQRHGIRVPRDEYVTGVHQVHGGSGDPSPFTAYGTLQGLMATLNRSTATRKSASTRTRCRASGHVGMEFVKLLKERGAKIFVTDINKALVDKAVTEYGAEAVGLDEIYDVPVDVYSPCALGATVNEQTLPRLKAKVHLAARPTTSWPTRRSATKSRSAASSTRRSYAVNAAA